MDFVHEVKRISEEYGFLLVFDEVITGLRQGPHGAQDLYQIKPDLATYGKVFGGGALPGVCTWFLTIPDGDVSVILLSTRTPGKPRCGMLAVQVAGLAAGAASGR